MSQVLNILRKDVRHLWLEVASSLTVLVGFCYFEPKSWQQGYPSLISPSTLSTLLSALLCLSWAAMIIRVVQAERLVGLNQFWTTRPYEWPKLMAAKALFVLAFVYVPFELAQLYLLVKAGLPIAGNAGFLIEDLALLTGVLLLPIAVFAALTRFFGQASMGIGATLTLLAVVGASPAARGEMSPRGLLLAVALLLGAVSCAVLVSQYSRRMTRRSLMIAALVPVLFLTVELTVPGSPLATKGYETPGEGAPITVAFDPNPLRVFGERRTDNLYSQVLLRVPIAVDGFSAGTSFAKQAEKIELTGSNGYSWQSGWTTDGVFFAPPVVPGPMLTYFEMAIPRRVYDKLGGGTVSLGAQFALAELKDMPPIERKLSTAGEAVPGLGACGLDDSWAQVNCRTAFRMSTLFVVNTVRKLGPCTAPDTRTQPVHTFYGAPGGTESMLRLTPVTTGRLQFQGPEEPQYRAVSANLCEGTPISFGEKRLQRRLVVTMPAATVQLSDYASLVKGK